ncbi:MAG: zinc-binding dehydrogenase, partial [Spirochaetota bacterium]
RQNFCENWQGIGVTLSGGMAEYAVVPEKAAFSIGDMSFAAGAFVEPLSCVLHGVERTDFTPADRVLIVGAGPIGILLAKTIGLQGASEITQVDRNAERLSLAGQTGAHRTGSSLEELGDERFDVVVDATGVPAVMAQAVDYARPGGTILLFGVPPQDGVLSLNAFPIFRKGLRILSSFTSVRNSFQAVRLLASGRIDVDPLISHRLPLSELETGIDLMETGRDGVMKVHILPQD